MGKGFDFPAYLLINGDLDQSRTIYGIEYIGSRIGVFFGLAVLAQSRSTE